MIYDITRELFASEVYPGDPIPGKELVMSFEKEEPDVCQLTELTLGSHSGTHMDAPRHFFADGKSIAEVDLCKCIGTCKVVTAEETVSRREVEAALADGTKRLLFKGAKAVDEEAACCLVERGVVCVAVESLPVAPLSAPVKVYRILLAAEIVILEGLDLTEVPPGMYELAALPLKLDGVDGSPVRAVLYGDSGV